MVWLRRQFLQGLESVSDQGAEQRTEHGVRWATCVAPPGAFLPGHEFPALPCWATLCRPPKRASESVRQRARISHRKQRRRRERNVAQGVSPGRVWHLPTEPPKGRNKEP